MVGRDGVDAAPLSQVPHFAGVVTAASCNVVAGVRYSIEVRNREYFLTKTLSTPHSVILFYPLGEKLIP